MQINIQTITAIVQGGTQLMSELIKNQQIKNRIKESELKMQISEIKMPEPPPLADYTRLMAIADDIDEKNFKLRASGSPTINRITITEEEPIEEEQNHNSEKATAIATGCVPCSLGHFSTASGLLNEAIRFANKDGMSSDVIDRVSSAIDEFNALERVDLRPEMTVNLEGNIKKLAIRTLKDSRDIRHGLENLSTPEELEILAAKAQNSRKVIAREWFEEKIANSKLSESDKTLVRDSLDKKLQEAEDEEKK
ncbi:MAG: hypothetical protein WC794_06330 [Candidatus Doudnabacteria bacterium]|jgi:hypothetical protein